VAAQVRAIRNALCNPNKSLGTDPERRHAMRSKFGLPQLLMAWLAGNRTLAEGEFVGALRA
jgi:hypothetical protein